MAKDPAFLFYPADWIGGVMGMTYEEKGAYITALMVQFNLGRQPEKIFVNELGQAWFLIKHKFIEEDGLYFNKRLEIEKEKRKSYVASRHKNKVGNNQHKTKDMSGHMISHMVNVNVNENKDKNIEGGVGGDFNWESVKQYFFNAEAWMYKFCSSKSISRDILIGYMTDFINDIELRNEYKALKDLQSHFTNWFNQKQKIKNAKPNKNTGRDELLESLRQRHSGYNPQ